MKIERYEIEVEDDSDLFDGAGVVPFYMKEETDENGEGVLYIEVYSSILNVANEFAECFEGRYFSDDALLFLSGRITPYLNERGYAPERGSLKRYYHSYILDNVNDVNTDLIREDSVLLEKLERPFRRSLVTFDIDELYERSLFASVTVKDDKIVSVAAVNEYEEDQRMLEITTETAKDYRGCGYAASNTALLSKFLTENGYLAAYCTSRYNKASIKIAKRCGFSPSGRFFAIAGYKR